MPFIMWHSGAGARVGWEGGGGFVRGELRGGGGGVSGQLFPISVQSTEVKSVVALLWGSERRGLQRDVGARMRSIRRSSQFVLPYPRCSSGIPDPARSVLHTNPTPEVNGLLPSGSHYAFSSIVSCLFTPVQLHWVLLALCWLGSLGLFRF